MKIRLLAIFCLLICKMVSGQTNQIQRIESIDMNRVNEIKKYLPSNPKGLGATYKDREIWDKLYNSGDYKKTISNAESFLNDGFPQWDQQLWERRDTHGDTQSGKRLINYRLQSLSQLVWAECLENKGRFVPLIKDFLYDIMKQKTWVNPGSFNKDTYKGNVELATALNAIAMSQAVYLLDDKLDKTVKKDIIKELYVRAYDPLFKTLEGKDDYHKWLTVVGNWNPVCLNGVTTSALTLLNDKTERAKFIAISERYVKNYTLGFTDDGYCSEGLNYYNFGMSHYIILREMIWQSTNGKIDLFDDNHKIKNIATFLPNMEIINDVYPSIADCETDMKPSVPVMHYLSKAFGLELPQESIPLTGITHNLMEAKINLFKNSNTLTDRKTDVYKIDPLRSYFPDAGVLVTRSIHDVKKQMGVALKGGNNGEQHNHNDIGSYTLVAVKEKIIEDTGLIPYGPKTFSKERFKLFRSLNSYGHSVPLVAEELQAEGAKAYASIINTSFSESEDIIKMDLKNAYSIESLKELTREFTLHRNTSSFTVRDDFSFTSPQQFETALTVRSLWKPIDKNKILFERNGYSVIAIIETGSEDFTISGEVISEGEPYTRISVKFNQPQLSGFVSITYDIVNQ